VKTVGLIVNPVAGMGGRVALKGTDGADVVAQARSLGATPVAGERAERTLARLKTRLPDLQLVAAAGPMGADAAAAHAFATEVLPVPAGDHETNAEDTRAAARLLLERGVDLILFAGGDGTARDIHDAVGNQALVLGIPTGVKMHSGVFATSPESAGEVAALYVDGAPVRVRDGEVVDVDEDAVRNGAITTRLYGALRVPDDGARVQPTKAGGQARSDEAALDAVCAEIASDMDPRRLYVLGPGTTTARVALRLGLRATLLGVDVVRAGRLVAADVAERELLELLADAPATLVVGVVGGQGALFGRGNQQLSPTVLRRIGVENVVVVAGLRKLLALDPPSLRVDTGDPHLDAALTGYRRVHVAPARTLVYKVAA
jgi:predicted polyphosphate/ATP-dependent NAD kinase